MTTDSKIILLTILRQREALYQIHNQFDITRTDLEILGFAKERTFFTLYDLQSFYVHTNIQQLRRSLKQLTDKNIIRIFSRVPNRKKVHYAISSKGKQAYSRYADAILNQQFGNSINAV